MWTASSRSKMSDDSSDRELFETANRKRRGVAQLSGCLAKMLAVLLVLVAPSMAI